MTDAHLKKNNGWGDVFTSSHRGREETRLAELLGLPFFEDCAEAPSKHRVGTVFTANNVPPQRNISVFDVFVTTGQTLVSMQNLLKSLGKNCVFFAGINNKL